MKQFSKNIIVLTLASVVSISTLNNSVAATYEVIDKGSPGDFEYTYAEKQNNDGVIAVTGTTGYNFPVQYEYLDDNDFYNIFIFSSGNLEDYSSMVEGNPTANDLAWVKAYLLSKATDTDIGYQFQYQVVSEVVAMLNFGDDSDNNEVRVFDTDFDGTYTFGGTLTRSTIDSIAGITDSGTAYGTATAPYLAIDPYTNTDGDVTQYWVREHGLRGFYSPDSGSTIYPVEPMETSYGGGVSAIFDMNENGDAVGYTSYALVDGIEDAILDADTGCTEPNSYDIPYEVCIQNQSGQYHTQAFKASLSSSGEVNSELLGMLITPHEDDLRTHVSQALAINNNGVAVGYSYGWDDNDVVTPTATQSVTGSYAVVFKEGKVLGFNEEHYTLATSGSVFAFSSALDINDDGLAVGYTHDISTGVFVKKFFYVDTNVSDSKMEMIIPTGFFSSSESTAYAVNSFGVIVGEGQIESHNETSSNPRRTAGFMYETLGNANETIDLNDLIECNSDYNIFTASDINDNGQISATAVVKENTYDAEGELILDSSGDPVQVDVVRAVLLNPIEGGEVEDCSSVEEKVERQGASFGGFTVLGLLTLFGLRRRRVMS